MTLLRFFHVSTMHKREKKEEVVHAQEKLVKIVQVSEEREYHN